MSYASWDLLEAREQFPAAAFLEIYRVASGNATADYGDLEAALAERAGFLTDPERALDETEWWLARAGGDGGRAAAHRPVRRQAGDDHAAAGPQPVAAAGVTGPPRPCARPTRGSSTDTRR